MGETMGLPSYEIWLTDDKGMRIAQITTFSALTVSREVSAIGWMELTLPASFDTSLVTVPDRIVQVWRQPRGGALSLWRPYFIRKWRWQMQGSSEVLVVEGPDCNDLLRRRIVAHYSGSANANQFTFADDAMKAYVTDAIADGVNPTPTAGTRVWSDFSVAADISAGPVVEQTAGWSQLATPSGGGGVLSDLAAKSKAEGTEVFFDVVPDVVTSSSITFQFRTYTGQPGQDVSDRVVFDQADGNLADPTLEYDYSEEINYVYAGGQAEGQARNIQQVFDADRYNVSQWNRCEGFADALNEGTSAGVQAVGNALLSQGRPIRRFSGMPLDTLGTRFGVQWDHGYKVRAIYRDAEFDAIVRATVIQVGDNGSETIQARLDYEGV